MKNQPDPIIQRIARYIRQSPHRRFIKAAIRCSPDPEDRAIMLLAEGAELLSICRFNAAQPIDRITIQPDDDLGGYHIRDWNSTETADDL